MSLSYIRSTVSWSSMFSPTLPFTQVLHCNSLECILIDFLTEPVHIISLPGHVLVTVLCHLHTGFTVCR
jgi:hypothetical protein